jgi:hypothetical protein
MFLILISVFGWSCSLLVSLPRDTEKPAFDTCVPASQAETGGLLRIAPRNIPPPSPLLTSLLPLPPLLLTSPLPLPPQRTVLLGTPMELILGLLQ